MKFHYLPFPPSTNNLFFSRIVRGKMMRIKSNEYRSFSTEFSLKMSPQIKGHIDGLLAIDLYFYAPRSKWFTKDNRPKRIDLSNRIKAFEDELFKSLDLDDSSVFEIHAFKKIANEEFVDVELRRVDSPVQESA